MESSTSEASGPLTPAVFHILLVLAGGDAHGYAIMNEVSRLTKGPLRQSNKNLTSRRRSTAPSKQYPSIPRRGPKFASRPLVGAASQFNCGQCRAAILVPITVAEPAA